MFPMGKACYSVSHFGSPESKRKLKLEPPSNTSFSSSKTWKDHVCKLHAQGTTIENSVFDNTVNSSDSEMEESGFYKDKGVTAWVHARKQDQHNRVTGHLPAKF